MAKQTATFELALPPRNPKINPARWLYSALRAEILSGRLRSQARLPSTRNLALEYGLSRGTIVSAFEQLQSEGYLESTVGSGTRVSKTLPEAFLKTAPRVTTLVSAPNQRSIALSDYAGRVQLFAGYENGPVCAFRPNLPALNLFPVELWAQIAARSIRRLSFQQLMGSEPLGCRPLREAVADYLVSSRAVKCTPEQVAIVSGVQEALGLTARILLNPGDRVCMEDPGYPGAHAVFAAVGAKISLIRSSFNHPAAKLIYITPGHQFPIGSTMSLDRRLQLLQRAKQFGSCIFEDDYDSEFRYVGRPVPALQGLVEDSPVFYAGSFSKVLFPGLRLGYLVAPKELFQPIEAAISLTIRHAPMLDQIVLAEFITQGHFARHLRRMRNTYSERLSVLKEQVSRRLAAALEITAIEAGLQTAAWLAPGLDSRSVAKAAAKRGVKVTPLQEYAVRPMRRQGLQLGFAAIEPKEIKRGVHELAAAIAEVRRV